MDKTIVIIDETSNIGGAEINLKLLAENLSKYSWKPIVLLPFEGELVGELEQENVPVHIIPGAPKYSVSFYLGQQKIPNPFALAANIILGLVWTTRLRRYLLKTKPDVVQTVSLWSHAFGGLAGKLSKTPVVSHFQDIVHKSSGLGFFRFLLKLWGQNIPDKLICISAIVQEQFHEILGESEKIELIWNTVDVNKFTPVSKDTHQKKEVVIGTVGRLTHWKGQHVALDIAKALNDAGVSFQWVFAGDSALGSESYKQFLLERVRVYSLDEKVEFLGWFDDMLDFYHSIDLLVHLPVEPEPFGLVLAEAMACGVPVITVDSGGAADIVSSGGGVVIPGDNPHLAEKEIVRFWENRNDLEQASVLARTFAAEQFNLDRYTQRWIDVYQSLISGE